LAIDTRQQALVELLIANGADVNLRAENEETALFFVVDLEPEDSDMLDILNLLLRSGADIHAKNIHGNTPLHEAAFYGEKPAVRFLIDHGADIQSTNLHGASPLHLAAQEGLAEMVNLLLDNGAQVNSVTLTGCTALHYAIAANFIRNKLQDYLTTIETLLQRGANPLAQTQDLETPLDLAKTKAIYPKIALLLNRYGAK
jgi:ankyrin repeat protein